LQHITVSLVLLESRRPDWTLPKLALKPCVVKPAAASSPAAGAVKPQTCRTSTGAAAGAWLNARRAVCAAGRDRRDWIEGARARILVILEVVVAILDDAE